MWDKRKRYRITAFFTALIFLVANTSWAQIPSPVSLPDRGPAELSSLERFIIPDELGRIEAQYQAAPDKPFIIYIQDAHAIWDAQNRIQGLIEYLQEKYGVSLIALEGGKGKLDPTLFRTFPNELVKKKVLSQYLERGELSGAEMAAIFNSKEARYYGIEDWNLYEENYLAYLRSQQVKEKLLEKLKTLESQSDQEREKTYSPQLNEFHKHVEAFYEESSHLIEPLKYLQSLRVSQAMLQEKYRHLAILFESLARDSSLEKESLEVQIRKLENGFRKKFFSKLSLEKQKEFNRHSQAFLTGAIDPGSFLKVLVETAYTLRVKPKLSPTLQALLGHVETLSTIKGTRLFDELQDFLGDVEANLITKPEEKDLAERYKKLRLLKDLTNLELTREQWEEYQRNSEPYVSLLGEQDKLLNPANEFYRVAFERDQAFHRNLENLLKSEKANSAIVLAGGFHAQGFEASLKDAGYSYAVISPRINSLEGQKAYQEIMAGKLSYKSYLKTTFYDAFVRHSSINLVNELNEPDFKKNLKLWRDEVIRKLANEGRITEAGEYTRYIDLLFKTYFDKFGEGKAPASKEEILKAIEQELNSFRDDTVSRLWQHFQIQFKEFTQGLRELIDKKALTKENVSSLLERANQTKPFTLVQLARPALTPGISVQSMRSELREFILNGKQPEITSEITPVPFAKPQDVVQGLLEKARRGPAPDGGLVNTLTQTQAVRTAAREVINTGGIVETAFPEAKPEPVNQEAVDQLVTSVGDQVRSELLQELKTARSEVRTEIRSAVSKAEAFAKDAREKAAELRSLKWSLSDRTGFLKKPFWEEGKVPLKDRIWASLRAKADRFSTVVSEMEKIQRDSAVLLGEVMQDESLKDLEKGKVRKSDDDIEEIMNEVEEMRSQILGLPEKLAVAVTAYAANAKERAKALQGQLAGHFAKLEIEYASKSKGRGEYESFYRVKEVAPGDLQEVYSELKGLLAYLEGDDYTAGKTVLEKFAATYTFFPSIDFGLYVRQPYLDFGVSKYFKMSFNVSLSSEMMEAHLWQFVQNAEENMGIRITVNPPSDPEDHFVDVHLEIIDQDKLDKFLASQAEEEAAPYQVRETFLEMLEDIYRMTYGFYLVARSQEERKVKKDQTALLFKTFRSVGGIVFEERFGKKLVDLDTLSTQPNRRVALLGSREEYSLLELARLFNKVSLENEKAFLETGIRELEASLAENVQDSEKEKNDRRFLQELQYKLEDIETALVAYEKNQLSFEAVKFPALPQLPKEEIYYPVENQATPRLEASEGIRINIGEKVSIEIKFDSETQRFSLILDGGKIHELINKNSVVIGRRKNGKIPEGVYYAVPENFEDVQNKQAEILLNPKEGTIRVINLASNEISVSGYPYMPRSEVRQPIIASEGADLLGSPFSRRLRSAGDVVLDLEQNGLNLDQAVTRIWMPDAEQSREEFTGALGQVLRQAVLNELQDLPNAEAVVERVWSFGSPDVEEQLGVYRRWVDASELVSKIQVAVARNLLGTGAVEEPVRALEIAGEMIESARFLLDPQNRDILERAYQEKYQQTLGLTTKRWLVLDWTFLRDSPEPERTQRLIKEALNNGGMALPFLIGQEHLIRSLIRYPGVRAIGYNDSRPLPLEIRGAENPLFILSTGTPIEKDLKATKEKEGVIISDTLYQQSQLDAHALVPLVELTLQVEFLRKQLEKETGLAFPRFTENVLMSVLSFLHDLARAEVARQAMARAA